MGGEFALVHSGFRLGHVRLSVSRYQQLSCSAPRRLQVGADALIAAMQAFDTVENAATSWSPKTNRTIGQSCPAAGECPVRRRLRRSALRHRAESHRVRGNGPHPSPGLAKR